MCYAPYVARINSLFSALPIILVMQSFVMLPALDRRALRIIAGPGCKQASTSKFFILLEVLKAAVPALAGPLYRARP